jgi:hypothetical protein
MVTLMLTTLHEIFYLTLASKLSFLVIAFSSSSFVYYDNFSKFFIFFQFFFFFLVSSHSNVRLPSSSCNMSVVAVIYYVLMCVVFRGVKSETVKFGMYRCADVSMCKQPNNPLHYHLSIHIIYHNFTVSSTHTPYCYFTTITNTT